MCPFHFESVVFFGGEFGVSASCMRYTMLWDGPDGVPLGPVHAVMYFLVAWRDLLSIMSSSLPGFQSYLFPFCYVLRVASAWC